MIYPLRITAKYNGEAEKPWLVPGFRYVIDVQPYPIPVTGSGDEYRVLIAAIEPPQDHYSTELVARINAAEKSFPLPLGKQGYYYSTSKDFNSSWIEILSWSNEPLSQQELEMLPKR